MIRQADKRDRNINGRNSKMLLMSRDAFAAKLVARARALNKTIVFPEGDDARVRAAAARLASEKILQPVLIGAPNGGYPGVTFVDPAKSEKLERYAAIYHEQRKHKGVTEREASETASHPLYFANLMLSSGDADG